MKRGHNHLNFERMTPNTQRLYIDPDTDIKMSEITPAASSDLIAISNGSKRQKTERSYKRRQGTSLEFFYKFVKVHNHKGETVVDTSGILSLPCYQAWLNSRKKMPEDPRKTFRKTIQAHCRGSDKRRPFPEAIEQSLLKNLRKHDPWKFFDASDDAKYKRKMSSRERRKESGFRKLGYHETLRLKQNESKRFSEHMILSSDDEHILDCLNLLEQNDKPKRICYRPNASIFHSLDPPDTFEILDSGLQKFPPALSSHFNADELVLRAERICGTIVSRILIARA